MINEGIVLLAHIFIMITPTASNIVIKAKHLRHRERRYYRTYMMKSKEWNGNDGKLKG